jgi:Ca-activated chloride channel family protein
MNRGWLDIIGGAGSWGSGGSLALPSFEHPGWLLLIPLLAVFSWWLARGSLAGHDASKRAMHLLFRCLLITLICGALAEPHMRWKSSDVAVLAVVDVSDSVPPDQRQVASRFLDSSLTKRQPRDRFGVVTVADDALVQSLPVASSLRNAEGFIGATDATDLGRGIDLARAVIPSDAAGRILLISDGNQTSGNLEGAATALVTAGVPLDVAMIEYDRSAMVRVDDVVVPAWVRDGESITAKVVITAGQPVDGRLSILLNGQTVDLDPDSANLSTDISLREGLQVLSVPIQLPSGPVHKIEAVFEPGQTEGTIPRLLRAEGVTFASDRARLLLLSEDPDAAAPLAGALTSESVSVDVRNSADAPTSVEGWSAYDSIILFDQSASNYTQGQQQDLVTAVRDSGSGLIVVGGPSSFGAGGWIGSPLEEALPVHLDPPQKRQMPMGALAIIIDKSGSMSQPVVGTSANQQQLANEAAILGVRALSKLDQVTIIAFSDGEEIVVPLTIKGEGHQIERAIRKIGAGGGTNMFPALDAALLELQKSKAPAKHIVILTDGVTTGDPADGLQKAQEFRQRGITMSTVSIGDQSNDELLKRMAELGGGRGYQVRSNNALAVLPQIFIKEAQTVRRALIWEGPAFSPRLAGGGESLRAISGTLPAMSGYVVTAERGGLATVPIRGPENDPILAQWQWGLGRVTAYTSDSAARWNSAWIGWDSFRAFWEQQLRWVARPTGDAHTKITFAPAGDRTRVIVDLQDGDGERLNFAALRGRWISPERDLEERPNTDVQFRQVGPGQYEALVDSNEVGTHMLALRYEAPARNESQPNISGSARAAFVRRAGDEVRQPVPDAALLRSVAERTGGRFYKLDDQGANLWVRDHLKMPEASHPIWQYVALAAVCMFLLDVAARRIAIEWIAVKAKVLGMFSKTPQTAGASIAGLAVARGRARSTMSKQERPEPERLAVDAHETADRVIRPWAPEAPRNDDARVSGSAPVAPPTSPAKPAANAQGDADMMSRLRAAKKRGGHERDTK